jgi:hypothetical protein
MSKFEEFYGVPLRQSSPPRATLDVGTGFDGPRRQQPYYQLTGFEGLGHAALGALGAAFCEDLNTALAELKSLLDSQSGQAHASDMQVKQAQAAYDDLNGYLVVIPIGSACSDYVNRARSVAADLRAYLTSVMPDGVPPALDPSALQQKVPTSPLDPPLWLKVVIVGGVLAYFLRQVTFFLPAPKAHKLSGAPRKRRSHHASRRW